MDRRVHTVAEVSALIGISKNSTYEAIRRGQIPALRIGRRIVIPHKALEELLNATGVADNP